MLLNVKVKVANIGAKTRIHARYDPAAPTEEPEHQSSGAPTICSTSELMVGISVAGAGSFVDIHSDRGMAMSSSVTSWGGLPSYYTQPPSLGRWQHYTTDCRYTRSQLAGKTLPCS